MIQKHTSYIILFALLVMSAFNLSCTDDRAEELTSINYDRLFSPIEVEALVINRTDVRLEWVMSKEAESYVIELFENDSLTFAGTPVKVEENVTPDQLPFYFRELEGEMRYSARIKAIKANQNDSKWSGVYFKTSKEDIFLPFEDGDVEATAVTLRWMPGRDLTQITLSPGEITHQVTAEEIAAGKVTIEGLTGETNYVATLHNNDKVRGTKEFMTLVDIGNATPVSPEDDFFALLAEAEEGAAFALFPGTYKAESAIKIAKSVEIKGVYPYDKPVLKGSISLENGSSLLLKDITLDGSEIPEDKTSHAIVFATADVIYNNLTVDGCEIRNFEKGLMYLNVKAEVKDITFNGNLIHGIRSSGSDFIDSRSGAFHTLRFTNNTVYNSVPNRDFIRYDDKSGDFPLISSEILVDHNTLYGVSNGSGKRLLYVRFKANKITFTNNIVAETVAIFTNQNNTDPGTAFGGNNYFNAPNLFSKSGSSSKFFDDAATEEDPGFKDPSNGDFTLSNEVLKAKGTGDPRWTN